MPEVIMRPLDEVLAEAEAEDVFDRANVEDWWGVSVPSEIPAVRNIDAEILAALNRGGILETQHWHGREHLHCGSTHCRAGWAIHLAGEAGRQLEEDLEPWIAGNLIYLASRPGVAPPYFYATEQDTLQDIREWAAKGDQLALLAGSVTVSGA